MRPRTLAILFAVVAVLALFIGLYERKLPSSTERVELAKKVLPVKKEEVVALTLESPQGTVRFERIPAPKASGEAKGKKGDREETEDTSVASWRLTEPIQAHADSFAVERLLDALTSTEKTRDLGEVDPASVGLDKPRATVRVKTGDGETVLRLGADVPTGGSLIAGLAGDRRAYVIGSNLLTEVTKPAGDWRDKQMFHGLREGIERISLQSAGAPVVVLTQGNAGFRLTQPLADRADHDATEELVNDLTGLSAERFVEGTGSGDLGLTPPRATIEVAQKGAAPLRIELGAPIAQSSPGAAPGSPPAGAEDPNAAQLSYARIDGALVEVRTKLAEAAARGAEEWRSRSAAAFEVHQIEKATVQDGGAALELTRDGTDWKRGSVTISYLPVSDLLFALTNTRAERLLSPPEAQAMQAGVGKPVLTFQLHGKDVGDETVTLYPTLSAGVPVRASDRPLVLLLPPAALKEIQDKLAEVRSAKPVTPEKKD